MKGLERNVDMPAFSAHCFVSSSLFALMPMIKRRLGGAYSVWGVWGVWGVTVCGVDDVGVRGEVVDGKSTCSDDVIGRFGGFPDDITLCEEYSEYVKEEEE